MDRVRFPMGSLFLICDGSKALMFRNAGDEQAINLKAVEVRTEPHGQSRDIGTDRPGRGANSATGKRTALGENDLHDEAETAFIKETARGFDALVRADKARAVAIIAPPRALGVLRDALDAKTRGVTRMELAKDWVRLPTPDIEANLQALGELK
jgi:protein required for attachment to host cells